MHVISKQLLSGSRHYYRIRIGDYRIGLAVEGDVVEFL
ncbi:MAG TPA: plasmid stabilization protein, partial [Candidatus Latescibacteria bacterium]|nr:plasmid stabilization protein [Candidatus Latescibacterota bacterium]